MIRDNQDQRVKKLEVRTVDIPDECWDLVFRFLADLKSVWTVSFHFQAKFSILLKYLIKQLSSFLACSRGDEKYAHLMKFEGASEKLKLFKADLLSYESIHSAIVGCSAVFHVACPVEMVEPAVKGTSNVLEASLEAKVERVVYVSSSAAIINIQNLPNDKVIDESCWSDNFVSCMIRDWYSFSKTEAEEQALDLAERTGIDLVRICPTVVLGPILQSTSVNATSLFLLNLLKGAY
ncbi:hypothetical protein PIB30_042199 [Stylosanthes scabra]|uniref:3-beta hydroxysteroid dehydrogenase/isomerase domain-containing protein n=1 Tax=Stylosanthes scabra TaxID=79078 RepID=A0ABU6VD28_9FABA|nr:hypothetical protein [Stylosanthes scabra]